MNAVGGGGEAVLSRQMRHVQLADKECVGGRIRHLRPPPPQNVLVMARRALKKIQQTTKCRFVSLFSGAVR